MKVYLKVLDYVENTILFLSMTTMLVIAFLNVLVRNFTTFSFAFTEELLGPLFILVTLVGAGAVARRGGHFGFSLLTDRLPEGIRKAALLVIVAICVVFSVLIIYQGYIMTLNQFNRGMMTPAMRWPQWIFSSFVPIGGFFMAIEFFNFGLLKLFGGESKKGGA
ncbi:MAG: TRAP transporter small permease [Defluviitaleaceae bacterium]|nr:TRAP transporter small permease [Defluviitaleaceae bacterium]